MVIELRERTKENVITYFERTNDPEIDRMLPRSVANIEQALANYEQSLLPGANSFGQTIFADGCYIGDIWCYCIDTNETPNAMLSYCIFDKSCWGRGIASRAVGLFLAAAAKKYGLKTIGAFTYADNLPSIRVLTKNGFAVQETFTEDGRASCYLEYQF